MRKITNTYESLHNYGLWYYQKYFSSKTRLKEKLLEKSGNNVDITNKVLINMDSIIDEEDNIRVRIKHLIFRNKNLHYIKTNLLLKKYDKFLVENILKNEFIFEGESLLNSISIKRKIEEYKNKGKSRQYIYGKLVERKEDKELIQSILDEVFIEGDNENLFFEFEKIKGKFEKNKIIEKLLRKGFFYDDIKKVINNN